MSRCIMRHGSAGYCEHCPGDAINVSRPAQAVGSHSGKRDPALAGALRGWESLDDVAEDDDGDDLPFAVDVEDDSREELRALDASLSLDVVACAEVAVQDFAESIETDVRYAIGQLRRADRGLDAVSRALNALERVEEWIAGVTCE